MVSLSRISQWIFTHNFYAKDSRAAAQQTVAINFAFACLPTFFLRDRSTLAFLLFHSIIPFNELRSLFVLLERQKNSSWFFLIFFCRISISRLRKKRLNLNKWIWLCRLDKASMKDILCSLIPFFAASFQPPETFFKNLLEMPEKNFRNLRIRRNNNLSILDSRMELKIKCWMELLLFTGHNVGIGRQTWKALVSLISRSEEKKEKTAIWKLVTKKSCGPILSRGRRVFSIQSHKNKLTDNVS